MGMRDKHRRAWMHTRSPDFIHAVLPALGLAVGTAAATCYFLRDNKDFEMSDVIFPSLAGLGVFFLFLLLIHGGEYIYRFLTGKPSAGSPRTLMGLKLEPIREQLRSEAPIAWNHVAYATSDVIEVEEFARELYDLLDECGWRLNEFGQGGFTGAPPRDVQISLPDRGSPGLVALNDLLNKHGYRSYLHNDGAIDGGATIQVGLRTD